MIYRDIKYNELDKIAEIERNIFKEEAYSIDIIKDLYFHADFFIVAATDDEIIGYIIGEVRGGSGHIITLAVKEEYRGRGIGSRLLGRFIKFVRKKGGNRIYLEVATSNIEAIKFYSKHGFKVIRILPEYYKSGEDAYLMELRL